MGHDSDEHRALEAEASPPSHDEVNLPSDLLTVAEVAAKLRVSKMTIYRMVNSGELPAFKVGRSFRIRATAVRKLLSEQNI
ncbi:MAG TPA: helix-turn-helix domain-containing protein [Pseudonocardia sp.]|jgi:excisionase family DNA binding protein